MTRSQQDRKRLAWWRSTRAAALALLLAGPTLWVGAGRAEAPDGAFGRQLRLFEEPQRVPDYVFVEGLADGAEREWGFIEMRGQVVIATFWATWCQVCARELPKLAKLQAELREAGVVVVALSVDDELDEVQRYLRQRGLDALRAFRDVDSVLTATMGIEGVPTSYVIARDGRVLGRVEGEADWDSSEARAWLKSLAEAPAAS